MKAWYYNTTGQDDKWYIRIYEVNIMSGGNRMLDSDRVKFTKRIIDSYETPIKIGSDIIMSSTLGSTLIWYTKLGLAKQVIDDMFTEKKEWVV